MHWLADARTCTTFFESPLAAKPTVSIGTVDKITHSLGRFSKLGYSAPSTIPIPNDTFSEKAVGEI